MNWINARVSDTGRERKRYQKVEALLTCRRSDLGAAVSERLPPLAQHTQFTDLLTTGSLAF